MVKKTIRDIDVNGKKVLLRVDFNVPMNKKGQITDDTRIKAALPTIRYLIDHGARVIICSHLGRPEGKVIESLRLAPVARVLSELLGKPVKYLKDSIGPKIETTVSKMRNGNILLLENLRFYPEEEANDPDFALNLARLADIYVDDAFGAAHRAHASTVGVASYIPAVAGLLMEKELDFLSKVLENPERPFIAIVGGAKISDKLAMLENIIGKVDSLLIGGGMVATFLKNQGFGTGSSIVENNKLEYVNKLVRKAKSGNVRLLLPKDVVITDKLEPGSRVKEVPVNQIPDGWVIADIGTETINDFVGEIRSSRTVIWNGPLGVFEIPEFSHGTREIAGVLACIEGTTIIGGGSTAEAITEMGLADKMSHVSTGGGASLEFLEGKELPGVAVLQDQTTYEEARVRRQ